MNQIISLIPEQIWFSLSQAILHSLWQGLLLMIICAIMLQSVKLNKPHLRYWIAVSGIISFLTIFIGTFLTSLGSANGQGVTSYGANLSFTAIQNFRLTGEDPMINSFSDLFNPSIITTLWLCGFIIFGLRMMLSYGYLLYVHHRALVDNESEIFFVLKELKGKMKINENIQLRISHVVDSVFTYGFYQPVIVWPVSLLNNLSADEVELILAHELAHIKRKDYLVKMILNFVNIVLYYHPLVWWLNRVINNEREHACDLEAVNQSGNSTQLATALVKLQEHKLNPGKLAGNSFYDKNSFTNRIKRLFDMPIKQSFSKSKLTILLLFIAIGLFAFEYKNVKSSILEDDGEKITELLPRISKFSNPETPMLQDTIKPQSETKSSAVIIKNDGERSIKMEMENGEIKHLEVDGEVVDKADYDQYTDEIKSLEGKGFGKGKRAFSFSFDNDDDQPFMMHLDDLFPMRDSFDHGFNFVFPEMNDSTFARNFQFDFPMDMKMFFGGDDSNGLNFDMNEFMEKHRMQMDKQRELMDKHRQQMDKQGQTMERWRNREGKTQERLHELQSEMQKRMRDLEWEDAAKGHSFMREKSGSNLEQKLGNQLNNDGFLLENKDNTIKLTGKYLKINGEKMPQVIFEKYKSLFEEETGIPLSDNNVIEFKMEGKANNGRKYRAF